MRLTGRQLLPFGGFPTDIRLLHVGSKARRLVIIVIKPIHSRQRNFVTGAVILRLRQLGGVGQTVKIRVSGGIAVAGRNLGGTLGIKEDAEERRREEREQTQKALRTQLGRGQFFVCNLHISSGEAEKRRSGEAEKRRSGEAEKRRSGEAEKRRSGEAEKRRSGEAEKPMR